MSAGSSRPAHFWAFLAIGVACLLLLNLQFAPDWIAHGADEDRLATDAAAVIPEKTAAVPEAPKTARVPAAAKVPTIVARFNTESKEPADDTGIRALATAMIEDHDTRILLEGHSDTLGAEDFNHDLSLERANLVKARLIELGVSEERVETVGLGATHPLHSDTPDAASVNRRVEVRWVGKAEFETRRKNPDAPRVPPGQAPVIVVGDAAALPVVKPDAGATVVVVTDTTDAGPTAPTIVTDAGGSAPLATPPVTDSDAGRRVDGD